MVRRALALGAAAALVVASPAVSDSASREAARRGAEYIAARQQPSGAFFSADATPDGTAEALVALVTGGVSGETVNRALTHIRTQGPDRAAQKPAYAGRIVLGLLAARQDPRDFGGYDYVAAAEREYNPATGAYDTNFYANAISALGVAAAREGLPGQAVTYLRANQCGDGGFAWREGCLAQADADTTAVALSALVAAGMAGGDPTVSAAVDWLASAQNDDGGFGHLRSEPSNTNSTGLALSALLAAGEDPAGDRWQRAEGYPRSFLLRMQQPDGGFRYRGSDEEADHYATVQAVPGLAGRSYVLRQWPGEEASATDGSRSPDAVEGSPSPTETSGRPGGTVRQVGGRSPQAALEATGPDRGWAGVLLISGTEPQTSSCVPVDQEITGETLLQLAGVELEAQRSGMGTAVCLLGGIGCGTDDCFCEYPTFWGYWTRDEGEEDWTFSELGASERIVWPGSLDAWVWGRDGGPAPPRKSLEEVCSAADAAPGDSGERPGYVSAGQEAGSRSSGLLLFAAFLAAMGSAGTVLLLRRRGLSA